MPQMLAKARHTMQQQELMANLMHRETLKDHEGLTYRQPKVGTVTAQTGIGEDQDLVDPQTLSSSMVTFTPTKDGIQMIVTQEALRRPQAGVMGHMTREMGKAMAKREELNLLTLLGGFTTSLGSAGTALSVGHHNAAVASIKNGGSGGPDNEPGTQAGAIAAVYHTFSVHAIMNAIQTATGTYPFPAGISADILSNRQLGSLGNAHIFEAGYLEPDADNDVVSGVFAKDALWLITNSLRLHETHETNASMDNAEEINMFNSYAYGEYFDLWGVKMTFDGVRPTS
jgi:hypothetical protein